MSLEGKYSAEYICTRWQARKIFFQPGEELILSRSILNNRLSVLDKFLSDTQVLLSP